MTAAPLVASTSPAAGPDRAGARPPGPESVRRHRVVLRDAARALDCQMYFWGRDVEHPLGNLLVERGLTRIPKETAKGTSRYRQAWRGGVIELHGFCAGWYGPEGGILYHRRRDGWLAWPEADPPQPQALVRLEASAPRLESEALLRRVVVLLDWLHHDEARAQQQWSPAQRRQHHRDFLQLLPRRWWLPPESSQRWLHAFVADPLGVPRPRKYLRNGRRG